MAASRGLIDWRVLKENYIAAGVPIEQPILGAPNLRLVYDPSPTRLGIRLRLQAGRAWSGATALRNITVRTVQLSGRAHVEVFTDAPELFRAIYALINDVLSRMADGEPDGLRALELSLADFQELVARSAQLSKERAVGLFGELLVFESLLSVNATAYDCWIGTRRETHDFRFGQAELEVKTTVTNVREHHIHGLNQLSPTPDHSLSLISIRLGSPGSGGGRSLNDLVAAVRALITGNDPALRKFEQSLSDAAYESDHTECSMPYQLAAPIMAVEVGVDFPQISHAWLSQVLGAEPASRIREVQFTLSLEGLGVPFDAAHYFE